MCLGFFLIHIQNVWGKTRAGLNTFVAGLRKNKRKRFTAYVLVDVLNLGKVSEWPDRFIGNNVMLVQTLDASKKN
jgi:hypothetical protein